MKAPIDPFVFAHLGLPLRQQARLTLVASVMEICDLSQAMKRRADALMQGRAEWAADWSPQERRAGAKCLRASAEEIDVLAGRLLTLTDLPSRPSRPDLKLIVNKQRIPE